MNLAENMDTSPETVAENRGAVLEGRFRIDLSQRLGHLESGTNSVVRATDLQEPSAEYFAIISNPYSYYRQWIAQSMMESRIPGMVDLVARGKLRNSDTDIRYVSVFDMPLGGALYGEGEVPLSENLVLDLVLPSVISSLQALHKEKLTHRAIRANNLFFADSNRSQILLGEAVTEAPGSSQPVVYEPVETAMAHPMGRGEGTPADDIYATGVLILHLVAGTRPLAALSADEIYERKLKVGSFAALTEDISLSPRISDVLAGLLQDDPKRRWDIETLAQWREAIKESPRRGRGDRHAFSVITFESEEYNSPRLLAHAMTKKPKAAVELLEDGRLAKWVKNSLRDDAMAKAIANIQTSTKGAPRGQKRNVTTAVTQATRRLDPDGILWYRDIAFTRGALGSLMLSMFEKDDQESKKSLAELFESGLLLTMAVEEIRESKERRRDWMSETSITNCFDYMKRKGDLGFGLERCLYELNPQSPCFSPLVLGSYVKNVPEFIEIAEKKLLSSNGQGNPFDRHAAAFIAAKSKGIDKYLRPLANHSPDSVPYVLGQLKLFAKIQAAAHPGPLPGFCRWAEEMLKSVFSKIKSRVRREVVNQRLQEAMKSGNLETILQATDIERQIVQDAREYEEALAAAGNADRMAAFLANGTEQRRFAAARYGVWITSVLAITSLVTSMVISALYFLG